MFAEFAVLHRHARRELKHALDARIGGPDFGIVEIEAQEDELGVVLAAFIPGRDAVAPQLVEHRAVAFRDKRSGNRSEEHTSELQSLMRNSYAVFCLKKKSKEIKNKQHNDIE